MFVGVRKASGRSKKPGTTDPKWLADPERSRELGIRGTAEDLREGERLARGRGAHRRGSCRLLRPTPCDRCPLDRRRAARRPSRVSRCSLRLELHAVRDAQVHLAFSPKYVSQRLRFTWSTYARCAARSGATRARARSTARRMTSR